MVLPLQITNGTIQVIQQYDPTTTYLVYATWALVAVTILTGFLAIRFSQKQYETLHRPWLVLEKSGTMVDNVALSLENVGNLPAEKITVSCKPVFDGEKKIPSDSENEITRIGIIVPKQKYQFTFDFLSIDKIVGCNEMNVDIFVKYYFGRKEKTSKFTYVVNNLVDIDQIWCEEAT